MVMVWPDIIYRTPAGWRTERINAMPYVCSLCGDEKPATFLITPLNGGDTMPVGDECAGIALTGLLSSYYSVDAEKLYDTIVAMSDAARTEPQPQDAPPGTVHKVGSDHLYSLYDIDRGLCGFIHDTGHHCHSKAMHKGAHRKNPPDAVDEGLAPPPEMPAAGAAGGAP